MKNFKREINVLERNLGGQYFKMKKYIYQRKICGKKKN